MSRAYRDALSCFATGVTVVTARHLQEDWGMTCNSFSSVSLEPRLVLWSIRQSASSRAAFVSARAIGSGRRALAAAGHWNFQGLST